MCKYYMVLTWTFSSLMVRRRGFGFGAARPIEARPKSSTIILQERDFDTLFTAQQFPDAILPFFKGQPAKLAGLSFF